MKIFKGKAFFFKSIFIHIFLVLVISFVSICFWENPISDLIINNIPATKYGSDDVVLVMVDDKSTMEYRWPWQRKIYCDIFEYFNNYAKESVILFDMLVDSSDKEHPESDQMFFNTIKQSPNTVSAVLASREESESNTNYNKEFDRKFSTQVNTETSDISINSRYNNISIFPEKYFDALKYTGTVNLLLTPTDGKLRSAYDLVAFDNDLYPSIALKGYMVLNNSDEATLTNKFLTAKNTDLKIPITNNYGNVQHKIKFYKIRPNSVYSHKAYSAIDIIKSNKQIKAGEKPIISPDEFKDKIVVIGANAINIDDNLNTPVSRKHPGPDVQATIIDNFIHNEYLTQLNKIQNITIIIVMCILTFTLINILSFIPSLLSLIFVSILYVIICVIAFNNNITPLVITPLAAQLSTMIFGYSYRFIIEGKNKEKIKNAMGKYLSQDIMKNVVQNIDDIKLGGKKANVTVLFSDIRGFTSMSEKMTAEEVSMILNEYFSEMEPIITKYNGVINKFIGDAVMAIFGEPIPDINHAQNAVKCACEMLKKVEQLREKWLLEGKPKIEIGIGINTGEAFVGNIGSEKRLEYTVIGDTVNLASRIEGYNKVYKTNLLISSSTYTKVSDIVDVIKIADVTIRGKSKKMDIYEVLRLS